MALRQCLAPRLQGLPSVDFIRFRPATEEAHSAERNADWLPVAFEVQSCATTCSVLGNSEID